MGEDGHIPQLAQWNHTTHMVEVPVRQHNGRRRVAKGPLGNSHDPVGRPGNAGIYQNPVPSGRYFYKNNIDDKRAEIRDGLGRPNESVTDLRPYDSVRGYIDLERH